MSETEIEINAIQDTIPKRDPEPEWNLDSITYEASKLSYENFLNNFMRNNKPCIIKNISADWECSKKWIRDGKIDYEYMISQYGNLKASVANCDLKSYDAHVKHTMKVSDYLNYLKSEPRTKLLYLKDWHLRKAKPQDKFYSVPNLFASDWLNEYSLDKREDDFMFVYIGPKDSWTPVHKDVYSSFSWSVNIVGKKKWILLPPGEEKKLEAEFKKGEPLYFKPEKYQNVKYHEIIQEKGDVLFVPSNWHHMVVNLEDTISINHNWLNGCNVDLAWQGMTEMLDLVTKEIDDLKDLPDCTDIRQNMLKTLMGMDMSKFLKWLTHIGEKRLLQLQGSRRSIYNNFKIGTNHIKYDLKCILNVINLIEAHPSYQKNEFKIVENFHTLRDFLQDCYK